jgi:CelD/BcsL family acetyltransferase involved in cellulose biosynthesis
LARYPGCDILARSGAEPRRTSLSHPNARVTPLCSLSELEGVREVWERLQASANVEFDAYVALLRAHADTMRPYVLRLDDDGATSGLVIGRVERRPQSVRLGYLRVPLPRMEILVVMHGGLLGEAATDAERVLRALLDAVRSERLDALYVSRLPVGSPLHQRAATAGGFLYRDRVPDREPHWTMQVPADMQEFYRRFSTKRRHEIRRKIHQVERACEGEVSVRTFTRPDEIDAMIATVRAVADSTYQSRMGVGFKDDAVARERLEIAARAGRLRAWALLLRGEPSAFWLGTVLGETLFLEYTGYRREHKQMEPGSVLFVKLVESLCGTRIRAVDFGFGEAFYKHRFGTASHEEASFFVFRTGARGVWLNGARTALLGGGRLARALTDALRARDRVKRLWRDRLRASAPRTPPAARADGPSSGGRSRS